MKIEFWGWFWDYGVGKGELFFDFNVLFGKLSGFLDFKWIFGIRLEVVK